MSYQTSQNYSGQNLSKPVIVNGDVLINPEITIAREPFLLERYDFEILIKGKSYYQTIANSIFGAVIALLINMIAKLIGSKLDEKIIFDNWEVYAFFISLVLMIVFYLIHYAVPNERRRILKKINEHFETA